jgi:formyltetrahydrofolate deformylase
MSEKNSTAVLLWACPDRKGLITRITHFIYERGGNIIDLDEHVDKTYGMFFLRIVWVLSNSCMTADSLDEVFRPLALEYEAEFTIRLLNKKRRVAIFVSRYDHCLREILWRHGMGEFYAEIPVIISNHPDLEFLADQYGIPYHVIPVTKDNKAAQEKKALELLMAENINTVVLARYMQVLSADFVAHYTHNIINIHHSFLPAFAGGNPYKQAFERGVKIIGATCHYVTDVLDEGPIIEQDIIRISHKDSLDDLIRNGRDLERLVLARGVRLHLQDKILVYGKKTVVF